MEYKAPDTIDGLIGNEANRAVKKKTSPAEALKPFFMIWVEGKRMPRYKWFTIEEAIKEAERLALLLPASNVIILGSIGSKTRIKKGYKTINITVF